MGGHILGGWGTCMAVPRGWRPGLILPPGPQEFSPSPSESDDEEDEELCVLEWAFSLMETGFRYTRYDHEVLLVDFSDSD